MVIVTKDEAADNRCDEKDYRNTGSESKTIQRYSVIIRVFVCMFDGEFGQLHFLLSPGVTNRIAPPSVRRRLILFLAGGGT